MPDPEWSQQHYGVWDGVLWLMELLCCQLCIPAVHRTPKDMQLCRTSVCMLVSPCRPGEEEEKDKQEETEEVGGKTLVLNFAKVR